MYWIHLVPSSKKTIPMFLLVQTVIYVHKKCDCNNKNMTSKRHAEWDFNPAEPHLSTPNLVVEFFHSL